MSVKYLAIRPAPRRAAAAVVLAIVLCLSGVALAQGIPVPVPAFCPTGQSPIGTPLFFDDMENTSSGNWAISTLAVGGVNHWYYPPPSGSIFPTSGVMNLWGRDDANLGDSVIAMTSTIAIPATGARLQFNHAYVFESDGVHHFDGGVIEYSINSGATWLDAGSLITAGATYGGTLNSNFSNPLGGRNAFVNDSLGYTASQLNLASLAGQSVRFRFRIGTDESLEDSGWFIDDFRIYQCPGTAAQPTQRDFNGDRKMDILWRNTSGDLALWLMNGASIVSNQFITNVATGWTPAGFGDFNADGKTDILWRDTSGNLAMWLMNATTITSNTFIGNVPTLWTPVWFADFNGDGKSDILWRNTSGDLAMWLMNGTTIAGNTFIGNVPTTWTPVGVGDFNGDGKMDILWRNTSGDLAMWLMSGTTVASNTFIGNVATTWTPVGVGDFNGDGKADVLWRDTTGNLAMWLMNGTTITSNLFVGNVPTPWTPVRIGDFNGDGKADILWRDTSGNIALWLMSAGSVSSNLWLGTVPTSWTPQ